MRASNRASVAKDGADLSAFRPAAWLVYPRRSLAGLE
jgi:hypothetical protein